MKKAVYPGSFDPITNGHLDIIIRSSKLFPKIIVAVLDNPRKACLFTKEERVEMISSIIKEQGLSNVEISHFDGLLVNFLEGIGSTVIIRGLRAVSDFEFEFASALTNRNLDENIETIFLMTSEMYSFISSSIVKEVVSLGGDISSKVPSIVYKKLVEKFKK